MSRKPKLQERRTENLVKQYFRPTYGDGDVMEVIRELQDFNQLRVFLTSVHLTTRLFAHSSSLFVLYARLGSNGKFNN